MVLFLPYMESDITSVKRKAVPMIIVAMTMITANQKERVC
jgi:hypothetical protein